MAEAREDNRILPQPKKTILLHACCASCLTSVFETLAPSYTVAIFFYNPNIHPQEEYIKRLRDVERFCALRKAELFVPDYDAAEWRQYARGFENEQEGGRRCEICFAMRLRKTAEVARRNGDESFATTLTVSPRKNAGIINAAGHDASSEFGVTYLESNFKKRNGFKRSCELSRQLGLYRQTYCGCLMSRNQRD